MFLNKNSNLIKLLILTVFFSFLIFITKNYFFWWKIDFENEIIEKNYIEPVVDVKISETINKKVEDKIIDNLTSANKFSYNFIPEELFLEKEVKPYFESIDLFLNNQNIEKKINFLEIFLYKEKSDVRWKMQNKKLKLFWIYNMNLWEFLSVSIHEFWHFLDLYILEKKVSFDISDYFYSISWENTTTIKAWLEQKDFVSGYSMTNKYEDFAESFTYYIIHNSDFLEKTNWSEILKQKYDFFSKFVFRNDEFKTSNYKSTIDVKSYYRDITKIEFSFENFLQYLKK